MECNTARMLLAFARPQSNDLGADEIAELERHLAGCPECAALASRQRGFDEVLGRSMRQVEVPDRLKIRLHEKLRTDVAEKSRQRWIWRGVAAAAMLLVFGGGLLTWTLWPLPRLNVDEAATYTRYSRLPTDTEGIKERFRQWGYETDLPPHLNYQHLQDLVLTDFQGKQVPCLIFHDQNHFARVLILSASQFNFLEQKPVQSADEAYPMKLRIEMSEKRLFAFVFYYTGKDLTWLRAAEPAPG